MILSGVTLSVTGLMVVFDEISIDKTCKELLVADKLGVSCRPGNFVTYEINGYAC